jgi:hypothetical protein
MSDVPVFDRHGRPLGAVPPARLHVPDEALRVHIQTRGLEIESAFLRDSVWFCPACHPSLYQPEPSTR